MRVLGIPFHNVDESAALTQAAGFLADGKSHTIFTPNPEMLVAAHRDAHFKEVLQDADLNICDGKGISYMTRGKLTRLSGIDFMQSLIGLAAKEGRSVFLLGSGKQQVVEDAATALQAMYSDIKIAGTHPGIYIEEKPMSEDKNRLILSHSKDENDAMLETIIEASPDILFVGFGHSKQEKWINENLAHLPSVKIAMGVGGSFDVLSGKIKRAPRILRWLGLEWLWRVIRQPKRILRIWRAVILFPYYYIRYQKQYAD